MSDKDNLRIKLESLLNELVRICKKNEIDYFLMEEALVSAIRGKRFSEDWKSISIAVHARDAQKIISAVKGKKKRTVESLINNQKFPGLYMRYVDTETLLYDSTRKTQRYKYPSVGIDIYVLFPHKEKKSFKSKVFNLLKVRWARSVANVESDFGIKIYGFIARKLRFGKRFNNMLKRNSRKAEKVEFYTRTGKRYVVNAGCFKKSKKLKVGDKTYRVPTSRYHIARLLNDGKLTLGKRNTANNITTNHILNLEVSGREFQKAIKKQGLNTSKNVKKINSYLKWKQKRFSPTWSKRIKYYNFYFLTKERFAFYELLGKEKKAEIISLKQNEDYEILADVLNEYNKRLYHYSKQGKGLFFDPDIFCVAILTMVYHELETEKVFAVAMKNIKSYCGIIDKVHCSFLKPLSEMEKEYTDEELEQKRCEIKDYIETEVEKMVEMKKNSMKE